MITVHIRTTTVNTQCRLCGERTPPRSPVICVYSPFSSRISRRYYCLYCWEYLSTRASEEIPDLIQSNGGQAAYHLAVLLGIEDGVNGIPPEFAHLDMRVEFPTELLGGRAPFERWYPVGDELLAHKAEAKKRMGHDGS